MERERSGFLGGFIRPQASFLSLGKSYIASLVAFDFHTMWYRISVVFSDLCFGKKPKAIEIRPSE